MMMTRDTANHTLSMITAREKGELAPLHRCDDCDTEFATMLEADRDHGVMPINNEGEFAVIICCEGYFPHDAKGKIKPIN